MSYRPNTIFGHLALRVFRHTRLTVILVALVTALAAWGVKDLRVNSNTIDLLPPDEPATIALQDLNRVEGGVTTLSITVGGGTEETRHQWLDAVAARLEALPEIQYTYHEMDPALVWRVGLLQLTPRELGEIRDRLRGAAALGPAVMNPFVASRLLDLGPLTERLRTASYRARLSPAEGMSRLIVRPTGQPTDLPFARRVMAQVNDALENTPTPDPSLEVLWIGGGYRHNVEDYEGVVHDVRWTSLAALLMVFGVIAVAYRDPRAVLLVFVPLVVANIWTLGFARLVVGSLNTFTSFISAVLLGLGIDFGIHLLSRYREERAAGAASVEEAVIRAWDKVGRACLATAATAASGFLALLVARFKGFSQLGLLLGTGVAFCLLLVLVLLPLLISWRERNRVVVLPAPRPESPASATYRLAPLGLLLALLATVVAVMQVPRLGFQYDLSELRRVGMAFDDMDDAQRTLARESYSPLVVTWPDAASLAEAHERLSTEVADGRFPEISQVLSVHTVVPPDQEDRVKVLREIAEIARHENARYLPAAVQQNLAPLLDGPVEPLRVEELPEALVHILGGGVGHHRMLLIPSGNMWDLRDTAHLYEVIRTRFPDVPVAGEYLVLGSLWPLMKQDAPRVVGLALLMVMAATFVDLRSLRRGAGAVVVLLAGMAWAGAALALFSIEVSIVNMVGIPILLGLGVATVIHLQHRLTEEGPGRIGRVLATTGWAAALCTLTTVVSFAALSFAQSQGVRSLGMLVLVGLTAVTLGAFVLLPLGWATAWRGARPPAEAAAVEARRDALS